MTTPPTNPPPPRREPCWKCGYDLSGLITSTCPECGAGPATKRDPCWKCGYDLADLETGVCPECGARFVTGKDLEHLHDRLLTGEHRKCVTCGTPRTDLGLA